MAPTKSPIAALRLSAIDAENRAFELTISIGVPYELPGGGWACPASMQGLWGDLHDIHGADSWQALQLAYGTIGEMLAHFVEEGGRLRWPDSGTTVAPEELFPRIRARD